MILFQFQFTEVEDEEELSIIPNFCEWLCEQVFTRLNTRVNKRKIQLRLKYLYQVPWIRWSDKNHYIGVQDIMEAIHRSLTFKKYRDGTYRIQINTNELIPKSYTSIDRLIRFLNFGDYKTRPTNMFTDVGKYYGYKNLQSYWTLYCMNNLGYMSSTKILAERR